MYTKALPVFFLLMNLHQVTNTGIYSDNISILFNTILKYLFFSRQVNCFNKVPFETTVTGCCSMQVLGSYMYFSVFTHLVL